MIVPEKALERRQGYPFCTAVTLNVCRRTCGETFRLICARFAIVRTMRYTLRTLIPSASLRAKCPSSDGGTRRKVYIT